MLFEDLMNLNYALSEKEYLKGIANSIFNNLPVTSIYMEIKPKRSIEPYAFLYEKQSNQVDTTVSEDRKLSATYKHQFDYISGLLTIAFSTDVTIDESITNVLQHFLTFYNLGRLSCDIHTDSLTGVGTRSSLSQRLTTNSIKGIIVIDVDNFKYVNDYYGHYTGDCVLERMGRILNNCCENDYSCYRYGGDEFIVIPEIDVSESQLHQLAKRISDEFTQTSLTQELNLSLSIGIYHKSLFKGYLISNSTDIADRAMYISKFLGKGRITVATPSNVLFYDFRYKMKDLWYALQRQEVRNSMILIKCDSKESADKIYSYIHSRVRKSDITSHFGRFIIILFDNEVKEPTFTLKYKDILQSFKVDYQYIDIRVASDYNKLIDILDKELKDEQ